MKSNVSKASKSSKRTHTLKAILERQEKATRESTLKFNVDSDENLDTSLPNLLEIKEDLPTVNRDEAGNLKTVHFNYGKLPPPSGAPSNLSESILIFNELINKEVASAAKLLEIDESELKAWIDLQIEVPAKIILNLLRTMKNLHLDPLNEEINFTQYEDGAWQIFITIEGCSKLLNQHNQFNGLVFNQADTLVDGIPEWIECSIFRRDRIMPITVREYLIEVRNEKDIWRKMPRRMLRHRALQQCVRLAIA
jgi:hypothetical protein